MDIELNQEIHGLVGAHEKIDFRKYLIYQLESAEVVEQGAVEMAHDRINVLTTAFVALLNIIAERKVLSLEDVQSVVNDYRDLDITGES
jgi:hypothetical protein